MSMTNEELIIVIAAESEGSDIEQSSAPDVWTPKSVNAPWNINVFDYRVKDPLLVGYANIRANGRQVLYNSAAEASQDSKAGDLRASVPLREV